jgi:two-component system NtrC family sensor kinase
MMPDTTGMDLHHELARIAPDQADRMVFMPGGAFTEGARLVLAEPPKEQIDKPFDRANLRTMVRRLVR